MTPRTLRRGLITMLACTAIAAAIHFLAGRPFDVCLVYAQGHGITAWLIMDVVHHRIWPESQRARDDYLSWRSLATLLPAIALSFLVGTTLGDAYTGHATLSLSFSRWAPSLYLNSALLVVVSGLFYAHAVRSERRLAVEALQRQAVETQLRMLQTQLEPHMLFNTLANLRVLIGLSPWDAQRMLDQLNDYLRASLASSQQPEHPLAHELRRIEDYLGLMKWRMGERLHVQMAIPESLKSTLVPSMILQPLVENAIRHGLEPSTRPGELQLTAWHDGQRLHLSVKDNGMGPPPLGPASPSADRPAPQSQDAPAPSGPLHQGGFGLTSTRQRLQLRHGPQAELTLTDARPGTEARVSWPCPGPAAGSPPSAAGQPPAPHPA